MHKGRTSCLCASLHFTSFNEIFSTDVTNETIFILHLSIWNVRFAKWLKE